MCVRAVICREGGTPSSAAGRRRLPARRPPSPTPRHNGTTLGVKGGRKQRNPGLMDQVLQSTRSQKKKSQASDYVLLSMRKVAAQDWSACKSEV